MPSRLDRRSSSAVMQQMPRHVKKVSVPIVPDISTDETNIIEAVATGGFYNLEHSDILQQKNDLLESEKCGKNTKSLPNVLHMPSTSRTTLVVPPNLGLNDDPYSPHSVFNSRKCCSINSEKECQGNSVAVSLSSSIALKKRSLYVSEQNSDNLSCIQYHRNSAGSSSSHGSSSGFESMKNGSSFVCSTIGTQSAVGSNSSFLKTSSACGSPSDILRNGFQSHLSMQSNSSDDASFTINNMENMFDDSGVEYVHGDNLENISRLSFSHMLYKGMSEAEILTLWLGSLGFLRYLTAFLTQGYDLPTIARITPEDLTALGITHPTHRKLLISEIHKWRITDTWPTLVPSGKLREWLPLIGLPEYITLFEDQGYCRIDEIQDFTWEDFEDIGIKKLGHLKRLGLATKKIKSHEFDQIHSNNDLQQLGTVAVHHNKTGVQIVCDDLRSHLTPPRPAPAPTFHSASLCDNYHATGKQRSDFHEIFPSESHAQKQIVQKHSVIQQQLPVLPSKILSIANNSSSSDSDDYPPPPAPLVCEGSIQLLRSAFNESVMAATDELDTLGSNFEQQYNEISSFSLNEQLSFAKDSCDIMKNHNGLCSNRSTSTSFSQPDTRYHSYSTSAKNGDVLNDIGCMLQNLTDELDAMLLQSHSIRHSPSK